MKLGICSDLHLDHFEARSLKDAFTPFHNREGVDMLVVAGDISSSHYVKEHLRLLSEAYPKLLFIKGNHDCWGNIFSDPILSPKETPENTTELERSIYTLPPEVSSSRILGCTLWTEGGPRGCYMNKHRIAMNDLSLMSFNKYHHEDDDFTHPDLNNSNLIKGTSEYILYKDFLKSREWLWDNLQEGDIVVTHHLPSFSCISPYFLTNGGIGNHFFASDLDELIRIKKPSVWIYGHTHNRKNHILHDTLLICNARGYPGEYERRCPGSVYRIVVLEIDKTGIRLSEGETLNTSSIKIFEDK